MACGNFTLKDTECCELHRKNDKARRKKAKRIPKKPTVIFPRAITYKFTENESWQL